MSKLKKSMVILLALSMLSGCGAKSTAVSDKPKENGTSSTEKDTSKTVEANKEPAEVAKTPEPAKPTAQPTQTPTQPKVDDSKQTQQPSSPVVNSTNNGASKSSGKVVVIDPGHANRSNMQTEPNAPGSSVMKIKDGGGAQGVATGTPEYLVNMRVAMKLKPLLESMGYTVIMTKTDNSVSLGNVERAQIGNNAKASLVIRIHADSADSSSAKGASMLVPAAINSNTKAIYASSKSYGQTILNTLVSEVGMKSRGIVESSDMTGFNWSTVPVVLIEMGFLSNPDEDRLLSSDAYENKLAKGLADGVHSALK